MNLDFFRGEGGLSHDINEPFLLSSTGTGKDDPQSKEIRLYVQPTRPDRNLLRAVSLRVGPSQSLDGMKSGAVRAGS